MVLATDSQVMAGCWSCTHGTVQAPGVMAECRKDGRRDESGPGLGVFECLCSQGWVSLRRTVQATAGARSDSENSQKF